MVQRKHTIEVLLTGRSDLDEPLRRLQQGLTQTTKPLQALGSGLMDVAKIATGILIAKAVEPLIRKIKELGKEALMAAGRVRELEIAAQVLGQTIGMSQNEVTQAIENVRKMGIRYDVAADTVAQMTRFNLDLAQSYELVRIAQGAAIIAGKDSSEMLRRLIDGISRQSTFMLRLARVAVPNAANAYKEFAKELGKNAEQLNEAERRQALLNAVITRNQNLIALYENVMQSPTKALRSLGREAYNLMVLLGRPFLGAFGSVVQGLRSFVNMVTLSAEEGGHLANVMAKAGATAWIFADLFKDGMQEAAVQISKSSKWINENFGQIALNALHWGAETMTQYATGLIQGAAGVLVMAMNAITSLLTSWLAPSSPPKVAPEIDQWGMDTMREFFRGMSLAEFDAIEKVQRYLEDVFTQLVDSGVMSQQSMNRLMIAFTADIANAQRQLREVGRIGEDAFQRIAEYGGALGQDLVRLAYAETYLAEAINVAAKAQERLNAAREAEQAALDKLNAMKEEYIRMLEVGVPRSVVRERQQEIRDAEAVYEAQKAQREQAEEQYDVAEERRQQLEEQAQLQERLLEQLIELSRLQLKIPDIGKQLRDKVKDAVGGGGPSPGEEGIPFEIPTEFALPDMGGVGNLKDQIKAALADALAPLAKVKDTWIEETAKIRGAWENMTAAIKTAYDEKVKPVLDPLKEKFKELFPEDWLTTLGQIVGVWGALSAIFAVLSGTVITLAAGFSILAGSPMIQLAAAVIGLKTMWNNNMGDIQETTETTLDMVEEEWVLFKEFLRGDTVPHLEKSLSDVVDMLEGVGLETVTLANAFKWTGLVVGAIVGGILALIAGFLNGWAAAVEDFAFYGSAIIEALENIWESWGMIFSPESFGEFLQGIEKFWMNVLEIILGVFGLLLDGVWSFVSELVTTVIDYFKELKKRLVGNSIIPDMIEDILDYFGGLKDKAVSFVIQLYNGALTWFTNTKQDAIAKVTEMKNSIVQWFTDLKYDAVLKVQELRDEAVEWFGNFKNSVVGEEGIIPTAITDILDFFKKLAKDAVGEDGIITNFIVDIIEAFEETDWIQLGKDIIRGITDGIEQKVWSAILAVRRAAISLVEEARNAVGANSPATEFIAIGEDMAEGLIVGWQNLRRRAEQAMRDSALGLQDVAVAPRPQTAGVMTSGGNQIVYILGGVSITEAQNARDLVNDLQALGRGY